MSDLTAQALAVFGDDAFQQPATPPQPPATPRIGLAAVLVGAAATYGLWRTLRPR